MKVLKIGESYRGALKAAERLGNVVGTAAMIQQFCVRETAGWLRQVLSHATALLPMTQVDATETRGGMPHGNQYREN